MLFGQDTAPSFFSVTYTCSVGEIRCIPQVCYKMLADIRKTVEGMERNGLAKIYREEVRFISGVPVPIKKPDSDLAAAQDLPVEPTGDTSVVKPKKPVRKNHSRVFD